MMNSTNILKDISPKNENSVIIYSPSSCSKLWVSYLCYLLTQKKILVKI